MNVHHNCTYLALYRILFIGSLAMCCIGTMLSETLQTLSSVKSLTLPNLCILVTHNLPWQTHWQMKMSHQYVQTSIDGLLHWHLQKKTERKRMGLKHVNTGPSISDKNRMKNRMMMMKPTILFLILCLGIIRVTTYVLDVRYALGGVGISRYHKQCKWFKPGALVITSFSLALIV